MSLSPNESQGKIGNVSAAALASLPAELLRAVAETGRRIGQRLYFSGGVVRDWILARPPADLDLTIAAGALEYGRSLAGLLGAAFVPLSPEEGVARVVRAGLTLDIAQFREGTTSIEADLCRRDFTVNALAVAFDYTGMTLADGGRIIDPLHGLADLAAGIIRLAHGEAFTADPLRLLRAYRFQSAFGWKIDPATREAIVRQGELIARVSGERIAAEFDLIFASGAAHEALYGMAECGLLFHLLPELRPGVGMAQPSSHHLDVFGHSLETLRQMEAIIRSPDVFFPGFRDEISTYLDHPRQVIRLLYAALLHDVGKTVTCAEKDGRITFYNHDEAGIGLLAGIARRLRLSNEDGDRLARLVKLHMWPFHLQNARVRTGVTMKAILKLGKAADEDLIGLFLLVMADCLAGQGPGKPMGMEEGVAELFAEVFRAYQGRIKPLMAAPLLTGDDLIRALHLTPGPLFKKILDGLLEARATTPGMTKEDGLDWVRDFCRREENSPQ